MNVTRFQHLSDANSEEEDRFDNKSKNLSTLIKVYCSEDCLVGYEKMDIVNKKCY